MKKNNKGFTLIEVIAIIVILSVIGAAALPNIVQIKSSNEERVNRSTKILIENAAKIYVANYKEEVEEKLKSNNPYCIPIGKLKAYDFLSIDTADVQNITNFNKTCVYLEKKQESGKVKYMYNYNKSETTRESDYTPPILYVSDKVAGSNCSIDMNSSSSTIEGAINEFNTKCKVEAKDDISTNLIPELFNTQLAANAVELIYKCKDNAGNSAKTLIVTVHIN